MKTFNQLFSHLPSNFAEIQTHGFSFCFIDEFIRRKKLFEKGKIFQSVPHEKGVFSTFPPFQVCAEAADFIKVSSHLSYRRPARPDLLRIRAFWMVKYSKNVCAFPPSPPRRLLGVVRFGSSSVFEKFYNLIMISRS